MDGPGARIRLTDSNALVDMPRATFDGGDARLEAVIAELRRHVREGRVEPLGPRQHADESSGSITNEALR